MSRAPVGIGLALLIAGGWLGGLIYAVFVHRWTMGGIIVAPLLIALQCWLSVGLFIVAHDCMHGSLAPGRPRVNRAVGRTCLALYAGFSYDRLRPKHMLHHAHPGSAQDPDFTDADPTRFWPWFRHFFLNYFGWAEFGVVLSLIAVFVLALHAAPINLLVFWGVPALLSALQLFYFGTFLPHRHGRAAFVDHHRARSNDYSWLASLLTCFHFGYHHEHHRHPSVPWWRLPAVRGA